MPSFDPSQPIELEDGEYTFIEAGGALVKLKSNSTGEYVTMHPSELGQRIVGLPPEPVENARLIGSLSPGQQTRTVSIADHLREIVTGEHPQLKGARPQFDVTATTQEQRVQAKLAELEATPFKMSRSTLMAKLAEFKKLGGSAIVDRRAMPTHSTESKKEEDRAIVNEAIIRVVNSQRNESTGTAQRLIGLVNEYLIREFGAERPELPSERTMYRLIEVYSKGKHTTGSAVTRRSAADRPDRPFGKSTQLLPGAEVQLDSTPMNIFVKGPGGKAMRPHLTIAVDVATRSILAYTFRLVSAKAVDHVSLITQALVPIQNQPDRSRFRDMVQKQNPGCTLLSQEEIMRLARRRPFIYPRVLLIDNGKDFKSNVTIAAAEALGISIRFSPPRTPTTKPIVERTFHSIKTLFEQHLPGFSGGSVELRGKDVENQEGLLDIWAVQELFHDWVLNVWQNRPHKALRDPLYPSAFCSPNQFAAAASRVIGDIMIPLTRQNYLALLPFERRVLSSTGFEAFNHSYDSPELHHYRGRERTMRIYYDPYNPSMVWARPADGSFIECPIRDWNAMNRPFYGLMTPDGSDLTDIDPRLAQRGEVALVSSMLAGTHLHQAPTPAPTALLPTDFDDDDNVEPLSEFTTESDQS